MSICATVSRNLLLLCLALMAFGPARAQITLAPGLPASPPGWNNGQFDLRQFQQQQGKVAILRPDVGRNTSTFVPSFCAGRYPPPGCQTGLDNFVPDQTNGYRATTPDSDSNH